MGHGPNKNTHISDPGPNDARSGPSSKTHPSGARAPKSHMPRVRRRTWEAGPFDGRPGGSLVDPGMHKRADVLGKRAMVTHHLKNGANARIPNSDSVQSMTCDPWNDIYAAQFISVISWEEAIGIQAIGIQAMGIPGPVGDLLSHRDPCHGDPSGQRKVRPLGPVGGKP